MPLGAYPASSGIYKNYKPQPTVEALEKALATFCKNGANAQGFVTAAREMQTACSKANGFFSQKNTVTNDDDAKALRKSLESFKDFVEKAEQKWTGYEGLKAVWDVEGQAVCNWLKGLPEPKSNMCLVM